MSFLEQCRCDIKSLFISESSCSHEHPLEGLYLITEISFHRYQFVHSFSIANMSVTAYYTIFKLQTRCFVMYDTIYLLFLSIIAGFSQNRAVPDAGLAPREDCRIGEPRSIFLNVSQSGRAGGMYEEGHPSHTYSTREASNCVSKEKLIDDTVRSGARAVFHFKAISPKAGGIVCYTTDLIAGEISCRPKTYSTGI